MSFEAQLVRHCAPTLAGLKVGSLFRFAPEPGEDGDILTAHWDRLLCGKGVRLAVLGRCRRDGCHLVYVYRPAWLAEVLAQEANRAFLEEFGCPSLVAPALEHLSRRMDTSGCFPHEIGLFLGYPLEDVRGFIEHNGKTYLCNGYWKVYGDPQAARDCFDHYRRCTIAYRRLHRRGASVSGLTVAS